MCGIAGIVSKNSSIALCDTLYGMSQAIKHRGPDGEGFAFFTDEEAVTAFSEDTPASARYRKNLPYLPGRALADLAVGWQLGFAHRRLSIIDLSEAGHQPMCDPSERYWLTFNGEIYNYIELRNELRGLGYHFLTGTDSEVILAAYRQWGVDSLGRFNGMFAFALLDREKQKLFCARDRVGVKPFYYSNTADAFAFASEYKSFIKSGVLPFAVNEAEQFRFLVDAELESGDESLFRGIHELKPAHYLHYDLRTHRLNIRRYYELPRQERGVPENELIARIEDALLNAVRLRLRSDVEVGSCLSGGLDSSLIAGMVNALQPQKSLSLFTAVFPGEHYNESAYAQAVSEHVGGNWHTVSPSADEFFRDIAMLNYYQDLPVWSSSTYSQHRVMQLAASKGVKVLLDGQGADELFGGYAHHYLAYWRESPLLSKIPRIHESSPTVAQPFRLYVKQGVKDVLGLSADFSKYFRDDFGHYGKSQHQPFAADLNSELRKDYQGRLKSFLKCEDRCSMAFGIESRVPFADDLPLVDLAFSIPGQEKIRRGISKYLLREAAKAYIPDIVYRRRDKVGFETPLTAWLGQHKKQIVEELRVLDFVDHQMIEGYFHRLCLEKPAFLLRLFSLAVWKGVFVSL